MFLPAEIIPLLECFRPVFTEPTYQKALILIAGTLLCKGRRTVCAALRVMGMAEKGDWSKYHHVLNRAAWDELAVGAILLHLIVDKFVLSSETIAIAVDETLERRWGPKIHKRGHWRDSLASSRNVNVSTSGLRWLCFAVVVKLPWSELYWSLPFLNILLTTPKVSAELGIRHKKVSKRTGQVMCWLRRQLPGRAITISGDGAYSVIRLGHRANSLGITLVAPLRLDSRLFDYPPHRIKPDGTKRKGRTPSVGQRLPNLEDVATFETTCWHRCRVQWYGGTTEVVDWATTTALWYSTGTPPLLIRWVLVRDPSGKMETVAYFSTDIYQEPTDIIAAYVRRWSIEVTFEEARAHMGIETQRQWSDKAIERTTPALFGLYSIVVLMAHDLYQDELLPLPQAAWYNKTHASFRDLLILVRKSIWTQLLFQRSSLPPDLRFVPREKFEQLLTAATY